MAERATISQTVQIGVESTPGTPVAASKQLGSIGFNFSPKVETTVQTPDGQKYPNAAILNREWSEGSIEGSPCYTELPYVFSSLLTSASTSQILDGATPTGGYQWTFAPSSTAPDTPKTFTIEQGSSVRAHRVANAIISDLNFDWSRGEISLGGTALAKAIEDGVTMTAAPTGVPQVMVRPTELSVFVDSTSGGLGTTKLTRAISGSFKMESRYGPVWVVDAAQSSFVATIEIEPTAEFTMLVQADAAGMAALAQLRSGGTKFVQFQAEGPTIYTGGVTVKHLLEIDMALQVSDVGEFTDEDGVFAIEYTYKMVHDTTWGKAFTVKVVTTTSAL